MNNNDLHYLTEYLVKSTDLPEFIETEASVTLRWGRGGVSAVCECPMPDHSESKPSFHINLLHNDVWVFHCFGCQAKGTIIQFCREYFGLRNNTESIHYLCKYYKIKNVEDLVVEGIKNVSKRVDLERQIENANILSSNQCRMLLRKDFKTHSKWVANAYKRLNKALDDQNYELVENIGYEASKRMRQT